MSATNGLASRRRLVVVCLAIVFALTALSASSASASKPPPIKESYLALGDSLAFGYSKELFNANAPAEPPTAFEAGYTNRYLVLLKGVKEGMQLVNNGCPGETSGGLIGTGSLGAALAAGGAKPAASCEYHNVNGLPLHHEYGTGVSQLENALGTIKALSEAGKPVTTVTLNIGANDELQQVKKCEEEAKPSAEAAYIKAYTETLEKGGTSAEADKNGKAAAAKAGKEFVENCLKENAKALFEQILKNQGASMFALREGSKFGGINYGGRIILVGGYNPYGNVYGTGELLPHSNALASLLNIEEGKLAPKFGACYANPKGRFNPQNKNEPARLQAYTNMANFTETNGKKNGPDIHPTPLGYKVIAKIITTMCP